MTEEPRTRAADEGASLRITLRGILAGALTIAGQFTYLILMVGHTSGSGSYVRSQFPMVALMPFVVWLFVNVLLKRLWPRLALTRGELLTVFSMLWIVGALPQWGWSDYWIAIVAAPGYMATPENQWADLLLPYLPWHALPEATPRVIGNFWMGLPQGAPLPWDGWIGVTAQWLAASAAMFLFGICLVILFQRQWVEAEKLSFPLAQMPLDMTRGFDGAGRMPDLFRSRLFWGGFGIVFLPLLYNVSTFFFFGLPEFILYTRQMGMTLPQPFPGLSFRVLPFVLAVTYLCPLDILGSLVFFYLLSVVKLGGLDAVGFEIGESGQQMRGAEILSMESYGAMVFVAAWSVWLARRHLKEVWRQVRFGEGDRADVRRYRLAVAGLVLSGAAVVAWGIHLGASLPVALIAFAAMAASFFVIVKLIAATGFPYLMPNWAHAKGESLITDLIGSSRLSPQQVVAFKMFTGNAFFGNIRLPAWPALPHHFRIFSLREQPGRVIGAVLVAFPTGFLVAVWASLETAYEHGGTTHLMGAFRMIYDQTTHLIQNPRVFDPGKWGVWLTGFFEAAALAFLRGRYYWFPLHPMGLAFQHTAGTSIYWFSLFLVWVAKLLLLRYGGARAYRAGKPFFYGMGIGYVAAVVLSGVVDVIWFPVEGHRVHDW